MMFYNASLVVLSYHRFNEAEEEYPFSRTFKQFRHDLETKTFDWITIDDAHASTIKACKIMQEYNVRAKLFISPNLIGTEGHCSWAEIGRLAKYHDVENHSLDHVRLVPLEDKDIFYQIEKAQQIIFRHLNKYPRYFVPPWNHYDNRVETILEELGLQLVRRRINIKNDTL